jgi:hypothetical protein
MCQRGEFPVIRVRNLQEFLATSLAAAKALGAKEIRRFIPQQRWDLLENVLCFVPRLVVPAHVQLAAANKS